MFSTDWPACIVTWDSGKKSVGVALELSVSFSNAPTILSNWKSTSLISESRISMESLLPFPGPATSSTLLLSSSFPRVSPFSFCSRAFLSFSSFSFLSASSFCFLSLSSLSFFSFACLSLSSLSLLSLSSLSTLSFSVRSILSLSSLSFLSLSFLSLSLRSSSSLLLRSSSCSFLWCSASITEYLHAQKQGNRSCLQTIPVTYLNKCLS